MFLSALSVNLVLIVCLTVLAALTVQNCLRAPYPPSIRLAFALTQNFLLAAASVALLRSTIIPFFLGECRLRYLFGFRETEPLIRRAPRSLDLSNLSNVNGGEKLPKVNANSITALHHSAKRLVDPSLLFYRPGALLSNYYWTPEYSAMLDAYKCLGTGDVNELDFDFAVWKQEGETWSTCELWQLHGITGEKQDCPYL